MLASKQSKRFSTWIRIVFFVYLCFTIGFYFLPNWVLLLWCTVLLLCQFNWMRIVEYGNCIRKIVCHCSGEKRRRSALKRQSHMLHFIYIQFLQRLFQSFTTSCVANVHSVRKQYGGKLFFDYDSCNARGFMP